MKSPKTFTGDNMNKKKIIFAIVAVLILSFSCLAFTACNKTSDIDDFGKQLQDAQSGEIVMTIGVLGVELSSEGKFDGNKSWINSTAASVEAYQEEVNGKIYIYTQDSNGVWQKTESTEQIDSTQNPDEFKDFFDGSKYKYSLKEKAFVPKKGETIGNDNMTVVSMTIEDGVCTMKVKVIAEGVSMGATVVIKNLNNVQITLPSVGSSL